MVAEEELPTGGRNPGPAALEVAPGPAVAAARAAGGRYAKDHRALLFGSRFGPRGEENSKGRQQAAALLAARGREAVQEQNEELIASLELKATTLKHIAADVGKEVKESTSLVEHMRDRVDQAGALLGRTAERLRGVAKRPGSWSLVWLASFALVLAVLLYTLSHSGGAAQGAAAGASFLARAPRESGLEDAGTGAGTAPGGRARPWGALLGAGPQEGQQ